MRARYLTRAVLGALTLALFAGAASPVAAQATVARRKAAKTQVGGAAATAAQIQERRAARQARVQAMTTEQRSAAKSRMKHRAKAHAKHMTPAQRTWAKSARTEKHTVRSAVRAGTMNREAAMTQRKAWRQANPRPKRKG